MMRRLKAFALALVMFAALFILGCKPPVDPIEPEEPPIEPPVEIEYGGTSVDYTYEGTETKAPYTVLQGDGTEYGTYTSMFNAIYHAGIQGKTSNVTKVTDANGLQIFTRQSINDYHCFDGTNYVGTKARTAALAWGKTRERCYVINGTGAAYVYLGERRMPGSTEPHHFELNAGAYNYMFSDVGKLTANKWSMGYGYATSTVRLSEATYMPNSDDEEVSKGAWNAYIFINHSGGFNIDLGLIGNLLDKPGGGKEVRWRLVRNCSHDSHKETPANPGFYVFPGATPVTTMQYNAETGAYHGTDDLFFEVTATENGWVLNITNLTTNEVFTIDEKHPELHKDKGQYFRMLFAASYCPVYQQNIWNARSGAYLKNVIFENPRVARLKLDGSAYTEEEMEDIVPNEKALGYGFAQGGDAADYYYDILTEDGTYLSGKPFKKGDKVLSFSSYYDGTTDVYKNGLGLYDR